MTRAPGLAEAAGILDGMLQADTWTGEQRSALVTARQRILRTCYAAMGDDEEHLAAGLEEQWDLRREERRGE